MTKVILTNETIIITDEYEGISGRILQAKVNFIEVTQVLNPKNIQKPEYLQRYLNQDHIISFDEIK